MLPPPPSPLRPAAGNGRPGSPVAVNARPEAVSAAAQEVLAADLVVPLLVRKSGPQMWAVPRVSRRELLRKGRAAALYVVCAEGCTVEVSSAIRIAKRKARPRDVALQLPAGQPSVLWVAPSPAERRRLRRARGARASFQVTIGDGRPQRYAIPISR